MDLHEANGIELIAANDMIVAWERKQRKLFEPETTAWMSAIMVESVGAPFVDVGASTGWFSVLFASRGAEVIAFEPNARSFARLMENCALNDVRIEAHAAAASDAAGEAAFNFNPVLPLTSGGSLGQPIACPRPATEMVRTVTLDEVVGARQPALIKIDVEGHEVQALSGGEQTIFRARPHLMLEANTPAHREQIMDWLAGCGVAYEVRDADERNMLCSPAS